jgi:hypothetical protein
MRGIRLFHSRLPWPVAANWTAFSPLILNGLCLASSPTRPRPFFGLVPAKLPALAFSVHPPPSWLTASIPNRERRTRRIEDWRHQLEFESPFQIESEYHIPLSSPVRLRLRKNRNCLEAIYSEIVRAAIVLKCLSGPASGDAV